MKLAKEIWIIIVMTMFIAYNATGQKTKKIYYDENWKVIQSIENSKFYRILKLDSSNKPIGEISDFYSTGEIYARGTAQKIDNLDDHNTKFVGNRNFYSLNGKVSNIITYNDNGIITDCLLFNEEGVICQSTKYLNGIITESSVSNKDGVISQITKYINGTNEKYITLFNENGEKTKEIVYTDSIPKYDWYLEFDNLGNSTKYNIKTKEPYYKEKSKVFYKDGETYKYYTKNGIIVTMNLKIEKNYGKYYVAYIGMTNLTGQEFNFDPKDISVKLVNDNYIETNGELLSSDDYMKKVTNKQKWTAALVGFGEGIATIGAGYSATASVAGVTDGTNVVVGVGVTKSYNSAENYMVKQNAQNNVNNLQNNQHQIKNELNKGYLKLNTIFNEERIYGQVNILFKTAKKIVVTIPINGVGYDFIWDNIN